MEEYLTVKELGMRIKFSKQSLYNLIHRGTFVLGKHYLKPTPKKILFKWTEIKSWMGEKKHPDIKDQKAFPVSSQQSSRIHSTSAINI